MRGFQAMLLAAAAALTAVSLPALAQSDQIDRMRAALAAVHGEISEAGIDGRMDAAITAVNLHDMYNGGGEEAAMPLISSTFEALRSGGVFGVIDHRGIAGQPNGEFHRMEEQSAIDLLEKAGFVVEATSEILANPHDDHRRGAGDPSLARNSDRFLIRARKP